MEQIDSGQIHLWLAYLHELTDSRLLGDYRLLLSADELQKQVRFHFERDRHRYLVTRAMARTVLSTYVDIAPHDLRFSVNDYGRPSIAPEHVCARGIDFNLSHADGLVVMAVACERLIGIDVENVRAREVDIDVADRYFAAEEVAALRALPSGREKQRFLEYWTLKESYVKARGMGFSVPLDRFAFHVEDPERIRMSIDPSLQDCGERWLFWQLWLDQEHLTALCAEHDGVARPYLSAIHTWP